MKRPQKPAAERRRRSRIAQLAYQSELLRGTLSIRSRQCGKASCRCTRGELHTSLYLVQSHDAKLRQLCIPRALEERVRRSVKDYQELRALIEELSELGWQHLTRKED